MSQHAGPPRASDRPTVPEPTYAERARTLAHIGRTGTLATLSARHGAHPFASVMPYSLDPAGQPIFLISALAVHTHNLAADPRASLLIAQPGWTGDPLAAARLTLMGEGQRLDRDAASAARTAYLARHERARHWVDFEDFSFWRLAVTAAYFVGGFAAMDWIGPDEYRAAKPDPLADAAPGILEHMNRDHASSLLAYARAFAGAVAEEATMVEVDRLGFKLRLRQGDRLHGVRIAFTREVGSPAETREVLIEMARRARDAGA
jgi:putative heme iron utilization protein